MSLDRKKREILKEFFETGDRPTEQQFCNLIESGINQKDDGIHVKDTNTPNTKIGIGTEEPTEKLDVNGNIKVTGHIFGDENQATDDVLLVKNDSQIQFHGSKHSGKPGGIVIGPKKNADPKSGKIIFSQNNGGGVWDTKMVLDHNGNIGIGTKTNTPTNTLHIKNQTGVDTGLRLETGSGNDKVLVSDSDGDASWKDLKQVTNGLWKKNGSNIENGNTGNVGIGTHAPVQKLDVNGNINIQGNIHGSATNKIFTIGQGAVKNPSITFYGLESEGAYVNPGQVRFNAGPGTKNPNDNNSNQESTHTVTGGFTFIQQSKDISGKDSWKTLMEIRKNGNVGIGTHNPNEKLHVNGNIRIKKESALYLNNDNNHGLKYVEEDEFDNDPNSKGGNISGSLPLYRIDGPFLFGWEGGALGSTKTIRGDKNIALQWFDDKRVEMKGNLQVNGNSNFNGQITVSNNRPPFVLFDFTVSESATSGKILEYNGQKIKTSDYSVAIVAGFNYGQEIANAMIMMKAYTYKQIDDNNGIEYWKAKVDFKKHNGSSSPVTISILLIRSEMGATVAPDFGND